MQSRSFFFTLVTGPRRSLSLKLSDARVYEPQIRARLGTTAHFCRVIAHLVEREIMQSRSFIFLPLFFLLLPLQPRPLLYPQKEGQWSQ